MIYLYSKEKKRNNFAKNLIRPKSIGIRDGMAIKIKLNKGNL